jgi:hypothetical protein
VSEYDDAHTLYELDRLKRWIKKEAKINNNYRSTYPVDIHEFSEDEINLLLDLYDKGGIQETRSYDSRYTKLSQKHMVNMSVVNNKCIVQFSKRGEEYVMNNLVLL